MENPIILKIFLIGFHHKKGWIKDFEFPERKGSDDEDVDEERLPTLCLPDQSHNFSKDSVFFILPKSAEDKKIFGVSCFRQIETEKLTNRTENDGSEFSRSSVQKAVCCLSRLPLFGYIEVKLNIIVDKIFEQGDFNISEELLRESYHELNRCLSLRTEVCPSNEIFISSHDDFINDFYIGICLRELITLWKHKVLMLFKLFLLERRLIFYGTPTKPLCTTILSIISLHPYLLNKGLCNGFEPKTTFLKSLEVEENEKDKNSVNEEEKVDEESEGGEKEDEIDGVKQPVNLQTIEPSEWFAPMNIFKNGYLCLPYISLHYMDVISDQSNNGFIVGASNVLFQQKKHLVDVLIDIPTQNIEFIDAELKKCVQLTTVDLRFFEHLTKGIDSPKCDDFQTGTDQWIRKQFESYFTSMLRTNYASDTENKRDLESFNEFFMDAWKKTNNYQDWLAKKITFSSSTPEGNSFDRFVQGHPFARASNTINVSDVKNKIVQSINNTQTARKTVTAVSAHFSNAKSQFSSWFSNLSTKEESLPKDIITMEARGNNDDNNGGDEKVEVAEVESEK